MRRQGRMRERKNRVFLMVGLGSIGQRHLRNIKRVYGDSAEILAYRVRRLQRTFSDTMQIREGVNLEEEFGIRVFTDLDEALLKKPDVVFVTNPTNMHMDVAIRAVKAGCHVFLEKPISDSMDRVSELVKEVKKAGVKVFVGYQNRLHPGICAAKETLLSGELGKVLSVRAVVGERLSTMHTYEDYKETYMARRDMGGGVVTNQLVHELDYLSYLFGEPVKVMALGSANEALGIDVESVSDGLLVLKDAKNAEVNVSFHADFFQSPPQRFLEIVGEVGQLHVDLIGNSVTKTVRDVTTKMAFPDFSRNDMFIEELKLFMDAIEKDEEVAIGLTDGIRSLKMALAIKESMAEGGKCHDVI